MSKIKQNPPEPQLDPGLARLLDAFRLPPSRNPEWRARSRAAYLQQVDAITQPGQSVKAVAQIAALSSIREWFNRKKLSPTWVYVGSLLIVGLLLLGVGAVATSAAQGSLPGQSLYGFKTFYEELRLRLAVSEAARLRLEMDFADKRVLEIGTLKKTGQPVPERVVNRLQVHLENSLRSAAGMDHQKMHEILLQIQQNTRLQLQLLRQLPDQSDPLILRSLTMLQQQLQSAEMGLADPNEFRQQFPVLQVTPPTQIPLKPSSSITSAPTKDSSQSDVDLTSGSPQGTPGANCPISIPELQTSAQPGISTLQSPGGTPAPGETLPSQGQGEPSESGSANPSDSGGLSGPPGDPGCGSGRKP